MMVNEEYIHVSIKEDKYNKYIRKSTITGRNMHFFQPHIHFV